MKPMVRIQYFEEKTVRSFARRADAAEITIASP